MSYEIIKSIKIKDNKVYLNSTSNNTFSINRYTGRKYREFTEWECKRLTAILQEKGREALDLELLKEYENGNMQRGSAKYTRALKVLRHMPEYQAFSWGNCGEAYDKAQELRKSPEFDALLLRALKTRLPAEKYIITKVNHDGTTIYGKRRRGSIHWDRDKAKATIYRYKTEAENIKSCFTGSQSWQVEAV